MKFALIILFALYAVVATASVEDFFKAAYLEGVRGYCRLTTRASRELVAQVRRWDFSSQDPALKRYCFCVYRTLTLIDDEADVDVEHAVTLLPATTDRDKFRAAMGQCKSKLGIDVYDKTYNMLSCYNELYPRDITAL